MCRAPRKTKLWPEKFGTISNGAASRMVVCSFLMQSSLERAGFIGKASDRRQVFLLHR
jgi:hypothetical protein